MSIKALFFIIVSLTVVGSAIAATPEKTDSGANDYLFVDNEVDHEYFITTSKLNPRFSGSNVWTHYPSRQKSLGYIGIATWIGSNSYFDMWFSNSPIARPFRGIRCWNTGSTCPTSGYVMAQYTDNEGFYHTMSGTGITNGSYGFASLGDSAYSYFRNLPVNTTETYQLNFCSTKTDYDFKSGLRCKDLEKGSTWKVYNFSLTKLGHLNLKGTGAMAEIWIASDGSPSVSSGSDLCAVTVIANESGLACKMVAYQLQESSPLTNSLKVSMVADDGLLKFTPSSTDIKYSNDGKTWYNYKSSTPYSKIFTSSGSYVTVFLSNSFFKKALANGTNLSGQDGAFTFAFDNSVSPESGFYQFTPSTKINILPREYGISIVSTDGSTNPKASGKIGEDSPPIEFDYKVTTSAARQADSITAQVKGDSVTLGGVPYCLFKSPDDSLQVPIPAYLSWISSTGREVKVRNSCSEAPVDMTDATWVQTAWNASVNDGFFFTTTLKLLFPMNDVRSKLSVNDEDWMGTVSASGTVEVTAKWIGIDK